MTGTIIFRNAFLIDGNEDEPTPDATLVVSDGTIREVIPDDKGTKLPKGRVIDLKGKALMPGLIDAHVHAGNIELTLRETSALPPGLSGGNRAGPHPGPSLTAQHKPPDANERRSTNAS